jgi:hypothetical protein
MTDPSGIPILKLWILLIFMAAGLPSWAHAGEPVTDPPLTWFGYGELNYDRTADHPEEARMDLARFTIVAV